MVLECKFPHYPAKNREFKIVLDESGAARVVGMSVVELSEYLLKPVLFDALVKTEGESE